MCWNDCFFSWPKFSEFVCYLLSLCKTSRLPQEKKPNKDYWGQLQLWKSTDSVPQFRSESDTFYWSTQPEFWVLFWETCFSSLLRVQTVELEPLFPSPTHSLWVVQYLMPLLSDIVCSSTLMGKKKKMLVLVPRTKCTRLIQCSLQWKTCTF